MNDTNPLLLMVCFPVSVHSQRWVSMLAGSGYRVVVFPSVLQDYCGEFEFAGVVATREAAERYPAGSILRYDDSRIESVAASATERRVGYVPLKSAVHVGAHLLSSPDSLLSAIDNLRPDILHTLELQHAGYVGLEARLRRPDDFPIWIASGWGSDTFLYRKLPEHLDRLQTMARVLDGFHSDCARDGALLEQWGFRGLHFPAVAASGGVDLATYPHPDDLPPPSQRRMILVKGYHHWAGRGMDVLLAIHKIAPALHGLQIRISHAPPVMARAATIVARENGLDIVADPYYPDQASAVHRLAAARVVVGYGISDGISTTLLEAMTVGTYCIQADTACGCEWIEPGVSGMAVPAHDVDALAAALLRAATDDDLVDAAVWRNRQEIEWRWSAEAVAPLVLGGYAALLGAGESRWRKA